MSFVEGGELLNRTDPVLGVRFSPLFFVVATVELIVAALAVAWRNDIASGILLAGTSSVFVAYRLTIYSLGWQGFCPCLGNFSNWSGINNHHLGTIMTFVAVYLFLGSLFLCAVSRRKPSPRADAARATRVVVTTLFVVCGIVPLTGVAAQQEPSAFIASGIAEERFSAHTGAIIARSTNRFQALVSGNSWAITMQPSRADEPALTLIFNNGILTKLLSQNRDPQFHIKGATNQVFETGTVYPGQWPIFDSQKAIAVWLFVCSQSSYAKNEAGAPEIPPRFAIPAMIEDPAFRQPFRARYSDGHPGFLLDFESTIGDKLCLMIGPNQFKCYDAFVKEFGHFTNVVFHAGVLPGGEGSFYPQRAEYVVRMADKPEGVKKIYDSVRVDLTGIQFKTASPRELESMLKLPGDRILIAETRLSPALSLGNQPRYLTTNGTLLPLDGKKLAAIKRDQERRDAVTDADQRRHSLVRFAFVVLSLGVILGVGRFIFRRRTATQT